MKTIPYTHEKAVRQYLQKLKEFEKQENGENEDFIFVFEDEILEYVEVIDMEHQRYN